MRPRYGPGRQVAADRDTPLALCLQVRRLPPGRHHPAGMTAVPTFREMMKVTAAASKGSRHLQLIPGDLIPDFRMY
jgi:hypothetical protein